MPAGYSAPCPNCDSIHTHYSYGFTDATRRLWHEWCWSCEDCGLTWDWDEEGEVVLVKKVAAEDS